MVQRKSQGIINFIAIHPEHKIHVYTKFLGNPSNSCWDISLKTHKCEPHSCASGRDRGSPVIRTLHLETSVEEFVPICQIDVEIFHCISGNFDLLVEANSWAHQSHMIHPLTTMYHECLYNITRQSIQQLLRCFRVDQSDGPTDRPTDRVAFRKSHITITRVMPLDELNY